MKHLSPLESLLIFLTGCVVIAIVSPNQTAEAISTAVWSIVFCGTYTFLRIRQVHLETKAFNSKMAQSEAWWETLDDISERKCTCGKPSDGWPGKAGAELCQMCWERECAEAWWENARQYQQNGRTLDNISERKCTCGKPPASKKEHQGWCATRR